MSLSENTKQIIKEIFNRDPMDIHYYTDKIIDLDNLNTITLSYIMLYGSYILYGSKINPGNMTIDQFNKLNKYINSIGYNIKYSFEENHNVIIKYQKIPMKKTMCTGISFFL